MDVDAHPFPEYQYEREQDQLGYDHPSAEYQHRFDHFEEHRGLI
jgi:hypothetical protein